MEAVAAQSLQVDEGIPPHCLHPEPDPAHRQMLKRRRGEQALERTKRPNIVLILADDMGYGDISRFNGAQSSTPVLDGLIDSGLSFSQHYSASPVCAPARAAILTGRYPHRTGAIDTLETRGTDRMALRETTLADELQRVGYRTGLVGKWHNGAIDPRYHPNCRGFDEFVGFRGGWQDYWAWKLERNGRQVSADGRYLTDVLTEEAVRFIRRSAGQPFFLHVAYNAPHYPFQAPAREVERFRAEGRSEAVATVYAMISVMDRGIGAILQSLDDAGVAEDTLVLFTSDNGPQMGGEGEASTVRFNCGLAGQKGLVYDGGIRLPLVARWPGRIAEGTHTSDFIHTTDWLPTILDLVGDRASGLPLDGCSQRAVLLGDGNADVLDRFWQWNRYVPVDRSNAAMRRGDWKLVFPAIAGTLDLLPSDHVIDERVKSHPEEFTEIRNEPLPSFEALEPHQPQLFNVAQDPGERSDVSAAHPGLVREMTAALAAWFESIETERRSIHDEVTTA